MKLTERLGVEVFPNRTDACFQCLSLAKLLVQLFLGEITLC